MGLYGGGWTGNVSHRLHDGHGHRELGGKCFLDAENAFLS